MRLFALLGRPWVHPRTTRAQTSGIQLVSNNNWDFFSSIYFTNVLSESRIELKRHCLKLWSIRKLQWHHNRGMPWYNNTLACTVADSGGSTFHLYKKKSVVEYVQYDEQWEKGVLSHTRVKKSPYIWNPKFRQKGLYTCSRFAHYPWFARREVESRVQPEVEVSPQY